MSLSFPWQMTVVYFRLSKCLYLFRDKWLLFIPDSQNADIITVTKIVVYFRLSRCLYLFRDNWLLFVSDSKNVFIVSVTDDCCLFQTLNMLMMFPWQMTFVDSGRPKLPYHYRDNRLLFFSDAKIVHIITVTNDCFFFVCFFYSRLSKSLYHFCEKWLFYSRLSKCRQMTAVFPNFNNVDIIHRQTTVGGFSSLWQCRYYFSDKWMLFYFIYYYFF